jgi:ATP-dependent RNA helicase DeaD
VVEGAEADRDAPPASLPAAKVVAKPERRPRRAATEPAAGRPSAEAPSDARPRRERRAESDVPMERFRIEVGRAHGVQPKNIVGAIANEAGLESRYIGRIEIQEDHTLLDLPQGMPKDVFKHLKSVWVCGRQLRISRVGGGHGAKRGQDAD